ncbi:Cyclic di-GMP phosphodiesterase response regulator RpfG [Rosistilla carotiformis]|uniref:diguanylate cyclase n=1 Tax=Rosistilla carotiformis TaxID=2528017 RepID=A0A518JRT3_9BACT|nr:diguanylate cyclase [Rosistilla carotiformis]QDV68271.1 Cyclic di-GMP phosphodiesterase response regulator RpfG [Rosistilla carotiformis]
MKLSTKTKLTASIVLLCVSAIMVASLTELLPDERKLRAQSRLDLCEALATSVTFLVSKGETEQAQMQMELFGQRHDDVVSTGLRYNNMTLVAQTGGHQVHWSRGVTNREDGCYVVSIDANNGRWGELEIQFTPLYAGINRYTSSSLLKLLALVTPLLAIVCHFHFNRILRFLDPKRVVPNRVRQTLDSFAEGVVLLDHEDRIVLANDAFAKHLQRPVDALLGAKFSNLPFESTEESEGGLAALWKAAREKTELRGVTTKLLDPAGHVTAIFSVNVTRVTDDAGNYQGLMAAFADVTPLERKRAQLAAALEDLHRSKQEISNQNKELRYLATRDPLTGCLNRRTFFELFDKHWTQAKTTDAPLCAVMVDIDFFKSINDNYGHSAGDEVLRQTGALLNSIARDNDVVCRYGGEEFSLLLPGVTLQEAERIGEQVRRRVSELQFSKFSITASIGLSGVECGADDPQGLLDQADKCLYVAKRNGRNQVVRFDTVPKQLVVDESQISRTHPQTAPPPAIPFPAVSALLSAMSYRDNQTAQHSIRVSNHAAMLAQRVLGPREVYVVEIAALLHDIGKIGVPDAILLKPGPLTKEEWLQMEKHDRIGVEIINKSFKHPRLTDIVRFHHVRFDGSGGNPNDPVGEAIPVGARILTIVDSFDAMTSDRPYRKGMAIEDAVAELRRCAGTQFDPQLVEIFVELIAARGAVLSTRAKETMSNELVLSIGEQVECLIDAADAGDRKTFVALAERLRLTAEHSNVASLARAANHAIQIVNEDQQLQQLVEQSFELLTVCRAMRSNIARNQFDGRELDVPSPPVAAGKV